MTVSRKETAMWLLERLVPGTGVNNVTVAFEIGGRFDRAVLARAVNAVVARHDVLRTVFRADDVALDKEVGPAIDVPLLDVPVTDAGLDADLTAFIATPFALDGSPLVRAGVRSGDNDVCCVVVHHLVFDAMSTTILLRELLTAYEEVAAGRTPSADVVAPRAEPEADERSIAYWRKSLDGLRASESGLWCAKPPGAGSSLRASTIHYGLSAEAREVVRRFQKELRASEAVVLLAAYYVLLTQHGAGSDVVIGTPVNVRDPQSMNAIGYHANLLPLRVRLDPEADFRAVVKRTRSTFLEAISHAGVPQEQVSPAVLGDTPSSWRSSFFRHLFNYVPGTVEAAPTLTGMPVRHVLAENGFSRFDLEFFIMPGPEGTTIRAAFRVDAFDEADVVRLVERYDALLVELGGAVDRPVAELSRLGASDRVEPVVAEVVERHVLDAVYRTVAEQPDLVAVEDGPDSVTYGELWSAALDTRDLVGTDTVAVLAPRGAELVAAWLGVWAAGAKVVLLDPMQPVPDLAARLADSGAGLVLAAEGVTVPGAVRVPAVGGGTRADAPAVAVDAPAHLEYPPTGEAVGVEFSHRALAGVVPEQAKALWRSSSATTAALVDVLGPLTSGGRVVVSPDTAPAADTRTGFVAEPGTGHELGVGVRGELCATGPALPTRHHGRPDLDAERFGEHPAHGRFHRTGDLAVRHADGTVEVIGRLADHVTVAGQRVHLADVERALSPVAPVAAAHADGTVFVFTEADAADRVREHAKATLPFVPEPVVVSRIPRTAAATLDRVLLAELAESTAIAATAEPPDETTAALVAVWTELLDRPGLHADSNFFTSGGHSLLGAQLVQKVKKELGLPAQLADLFANPTPRQLAEHLDSAFFDEDDEEDD
ncbi:condensation domain-containing protein [Saccharothrix mutabilis subsp. capreolus]|uniref:condensation domain-containing protein n=2 Tax=Saccharothrix TaxID=2071 RepID=UPI0035ECC714|nr:hypothetical protein GCM10017745_81490 [Saccharothrix mutabilis subsp. capreolus]